MAAEMNEIGRILLFTGDGKGKTTAALGMALRAAGHGMKTLIVQFLKSDRDTGERNACLLLSGVEIVQTGCGFVPEQTSPAFSAHRQAARKGLELAEKAILSNRFELVILDEVCTAVSKGVLEEKSVVDVIRRCASAICIVMTGRNATSGLIEMADTVTEMQLVKHGYTKGIRAQKGVEY